MNKNGIKRGEKGLRIALQKGGHLVTKCRAYFCLFFYLCMCVWVVGVCEGGCEVCVGVWGGVSRC